MLYSGRLGVSNCELYKIFKNKFDSERLIFGGCNNSVCSLELCHLDLPVKGWCLQQIPANYLNNLEASVLTLAIMARHTNKMQK